MPRFDPHFKFDFKRHQPKASSPAVQTSGPLPSPVSRQTLPSNGLPSDLLGPEALPPAASLHPGTRGQSREGCQPGRGPLEKACLLLVKSEG